MRAIISESAAPRLQLAKTSLEGVSSTESNKDRDPRMETTRSWLESMWLKDDNVDEDGDGDDDDSELMMVKKMVK